MDNSTKDFLIKDFEQAYENLRATDNKRDIIVGFYITLAGAAGSFLFKNYAKLYLYHQGLLTLGLFFLWIVGFIIFGVLIHYRYWHDRWRVLANWRRCQIIGGKEYIPKWAHVRNTADSSYGAEFLITFLHAVINSLVGSLFILAKNIDFYCRKALFLGFLSIIIIALLHLIALLYWYFLQLGLEQAHSNQESEDPCSLTAKNKKNKKEKFYVYIIPTILFLLIVFAAFLPVIIVKIFLLILALVLVTIGKRQSWFTPRTPEGWVKNIYNWLIGYNRKHDNKGLKLEE